MLAKAILITALSALSNAILLPPSISAIDISTVNALPLDALVQAESRSLDLRCTACPLAIAKKGGKTAWISGVDSYLQLQFSISHEDIDVLSMNGVQIYPPRFNQAPEPLIALQVASGTQPSDASNQYLRLGYELSFRPIHNPDEHDIQILAVHFQIAEIGDKFVDGLESVELKLLKTPTGKLMIAQLSIAPTSNPPLDPKKGGADCTTLICKFRATLADRLSKMKPGKGGCSSKKGSAAVAAIRPHKHHRPKHHSHHHGHHGSHRFVRLMHTVRKIAFHVLLPVLIGVAVGMTASIVGMIAGQMIIFFWRAIYRNDHGNYAQVEQEDVEDETDVEEKSFLETDASPPVYDEYPRDEKAAQ